MKYRVITLFTLLLLSCGMQLLAANLYNIFPVPQQQIAGSGEAKLTSQATLFAGKGIDAYTVTRAKQVLQEHGITPVVGRYQADHQESACRDSCLWTQHGR